MADDNSAVAVQDDYSSEPPRSSKEYLDAIAEAEKAFSEYQAKADNIDKLYANLSRLAAANRDREFAMFWANIEVLKPSIYSRPPIPVVVPRFKDRRPVPRVASELLERSAIVAFELEDIDQIMRMVRDDLAIQARGVPWVRYETKDGERACIEHCDRSDFLHEPARNWKEVGWVAKRAWLTKDEMKDRFSEASGDAYLEAEYTVKRELKDNAATDSRSKAGVWEIWHKTQNKVIWVTPGVDVVLDEGKPHLKLEGFYPCPKPAYGTVQRGSLVPVPDMLFYKDQLEEINELTARIAALSEAVKVKGFYPAGASELGDAIESAIKKNTDNAVLVPVSNFAAFGNGSAKDAIVWLPIDMITATIAQLVELRRQLIEDVYQITGLSDIMRGSTDANETLGAQQLKSQYGSVRIRDRQAELVRVARDLARIVAEIMAENFSEETLLEMSQLEIKTEADLRAEAQQIVQAAQAQVQQAMQSPEIAQQAQQNPQMAQQMLDQLEQQTQAQIEELQKQPTIEKVMTLLREQRLRPFVLDIETDSTIQPDEDAAKQRATEFVTAVGGFMQQAIAAVQMVPQAAPLMADTLKYVAGQFRAGRELEASIVEFADQMKAQSQQQKPSPEAEAAKAEAEAKQADTQMKMQERQADAQRKQQEAALIQQREDARLNADLTNKKADDERKALESTLRIEQMAAQDRERSEKHQQDMEKGALELEKLRLEIGRVQVQTESLQATTAAKIEQTQTQTENSVASTHAGIEAQRAKAEQSKQKEPA